MKSSFTKLIALAIGSTIGCLIRWKVDNIFFVNSIGSFLLGSALPFQKNNTRNIFLGIGFCGSLTTYSGWMYESFDLLINRSIFNFIGLVYCVFALGLFSAYIGFRSGKLIIYLMRFL